MIEEKKVWGIIFGGGVGSRFKSKIPKQYCLLNNEPLIYYAMKTFDKSQYVDKLVICIQKQWEYLISPLITTKEKIIVEAGETSHLTKLNALNHLKTLSEFSENDIVVFCDAVRPNVTIECLNASIENTLVYGSGVCRELITEHVMKETSDEGLIQDKYYLVKAPQTFIAKDVFKMYETVDFTKYVDTCSAMNEVIKVSFLSSSPNNIKVTTQEDFEFLQYHNVYIH